MQPNSPAIATSPAQFMRVWREASVLGWLMALYLLAAGLLGGGGSPNPWSELVLQLIAAVIFAVAVWRADSLRWRSVPTSAWLLAGAMIALPAVQLIPLPAGLWHTLPGRDLLYDALALIGEEGDWRPLSVAPWSTLASLLAIIPAAGLMIAVSVLSPADVRLAIAAMILTGLASAILGGLQMSGGETPRLYGSTHSGWLTGFYASRNAAVDHLLVAILAISALAVGRRHGAGAGTIALLAVALLLGVAALLTGSRAGLLLMLPCVFVLLAMFTGEARQASAKVSIWFSGVLVAVTASALIWLANSRTDLLARFTADGVGRSELWRDGWVAAMHYWPLGSGVGAFRQGFLPFESRDAVDWSMPNRMHNDYLEFLLEAGLPGIALLVLVALILVAAFTSRLTVYPAQRSVTWFAAGTLLLMSLHAAIDYPLRTMSLSAIAAFAAGILLNRAGSTSRDGPMRDEGAHR